jgi:hypothetical protein
MLVKVKVICHFARHEGVWEDGRIAPLILKFVLGGGEWPAALLLEKKPRCSLSTTHGGRQYQ